MFFQLFFSMKFFQFSRLLYHFRNNSLRSYLYRFCFYLFWSDSLQLHFPIYSAYCLNSIFCFEIKNRKKLPRKLHLSMQWSRLWAIETISRFSPCFSKDFCIFWTFLGSLLFVTLLLQFGSHHLHTRASSGMRHQDLEFSLSPVTWPSLAI